MNLIKTSSPDSSNENSPATPPDEQGQVDAPPQLEDEEPAFPHTDLAKLDDMINRWVDFVLLFNVCHTQEKQKSISAQWLVLRKEEEWIGISQ